MSIHAEWNHSLHSENHLNYLFFWHIQQTQKICGNLKQGPNNATGCLSLQEIASSLVSPELCEGGTEVDCAAMWCQWGHWQHKVHRLLLASFPGPTRFMLHHEDHNCHQVLVACQPTTLFPTWRIWSNSPWTSFNGVFFAIVSFNLFSFSYKLLSQEVLGSIGQSAIELLARCKSIPVVFCKMKFRSPSFDGHHTLQHW